MVVVLAIGSKITILNIKTKLHVKNGCSLMDINTVQKSLPTEVLRSFTERRDP